MLHEVLNYPVFVGFIRKTILNSFMACPWPLGNEKLSSTPRPPIYKYIKVHRSLFSLCMLDLFWLKCYKKVLYQFSSFLVHQLSNCCWLWHVSFLLKDFPVCFCWIGFLYFSSLHMIRVRILMSGAFLDVGWAFMCLLFYWS